MQYLLIFNHLLGHILFSWGKRRRWSLVVVVGSFLPSAFYMNARDLSQNGYGVEPNSLRSLKSVWGTQGEPGLPGSLHRLGLSLELVYTPQTVSK